MRGAAALLALAGLPAVAAAQGTTTGAIGGIVTGDQNQPVEGAQVQVINRATGFSAGTLVRANGSYAVQGLEVASTYTVTVRRIGYQPQTRENVVVRLGQTTRLDFTLSTQAAQVEGVVVTATASADIINSSRQGAATQVDDSLLRRLPSLNRNFTDFVALTPQISTTASSGGLSGGGSNNRFNNITIDGVTETDVFGLGATGQPGGQASGKSIGIESVKEYQVLLSPYDVRYGNFAGVLINAVTKSGTNEFHGSVIGVTRNQSLARSQDYLEDFEQMQYGFSLGGPIVKDKAFFFINPEFQTRTDPAGGPYLGQSAPLALTAAEVDRFRTLLGGYGYGEGDLGTATFVNNKNPLTNVFARLDFNLPFSSQLVARYNYGQAEDDVFSRSTGTFGLSQNGYQFLSKKHSPALQLRTLLAGGKYNELMVGMTSIRDRRAPSSLMPQVTARSGNIGLTAGAERSSQLNELDQDIFEVTDNFTLPIGSHRITIGTQNQFFKFRNAFGQNSKGVWTFGSLDSLQLGQANLYQVGVPVGGGDGQVRFKSNNLAAYIGDEWTVSPKLSLQLGIRGDMPVFPDKPPANDSILKYYGQNTSDFPSGTIQWSPRLGFNYDVTGEQVHQLRGGAGLFTGRPAYVWLSNGFQNSGVSGFAQLTCSRSATQNRVPAFNSTTIASAPTACATGQTAALGGEINLIDDEFKFPQNLRGNLAYDYRVTGNWVASVEGIYTKAVNAIFYRNAALRGVANPVIDATTGIRGTSAAEAGRYIYGVGVNGSGNGTADVVPGGRTQVFAASNQSKDYAYNLTAGLNRRYQDNYSLAAYYTYSKSYDVQSFTSSTAFSQYRFGRGTGYDQTAKDLGRSVFEQTHRIVAYGTYTFPSKTDVSFQYFGESGSPFYYTVNGDPNADGITQNDPIYVPTDARDPNQMAWATTRTFGNTVYTGAQMAEAFENYISDLDCLNDQRGTLLKRNSCTNPFTHGVNVLVRQSLPEVRGQTVTLELGVFNFLNLLNNKWGEQPSTGTGAVGNMLTMTGIQGTAGNLVTGRPIYAFDPNWQKFLQQNSGSNYQIQLQARYAF